jgi:hypothetical protein
MFVHCNLKVMEPNGPVGDDDLGLLQFCYGGSCSQLRVQLVDAESDSDSVTHMAEHYDNDDDDGVGENDNDGSDDEEV